MDSASVSNKQEPRRTVSHWSGWVAAGAGLFVVFSRIVCPTLVMILGVVMVVGAVLLLVRPCDWRALNNYINPGDPKTAFWNRLSLILLICIVGALVLMSLPNCGPPISDRAKNSEISQNLWDIQTILWRYTSEAESGYPASLASAGFIEYTGEGYSHSNPYYEFYRNISDEYPRELYRMQQLGADRFPDELREYLLPQGGYCYIPIIGQTGDEEGQVLDYLLFGIGNQRREPTFSQWAEDVPVVVYPMY